jgi:glycosyltransferase involved in cell wall biosynthesis
METGGAWERGAACHVVTPTGQALPALERDAVDSALLGTGVAGGVRQPKSRSVRVLSTSSGNGFLGATALCKPRLISVVIPSYNHERFVGEAVASVSRQTHRPLEVLLVDDGSPDETFEAGLAGLRESDLPFLAIKKENQGSCVPGINAGIGLAHGEFISLLASDDVYCPRKLEASIGALESSGADLVVGRVQRISPDGEPIPGSETDLDGLRTWYGRRRLLEGMFVNGSGAAIPYLGVVFRRDLFDRIGLFDPTFLTEDLEMAMRIAASDMRLAFVDDVVGLHRFVNRGGGYHLRIAEDSERIARRYAPSLRARAQAVAAAKVGQFLALRRSQPMRSTWLALGGVLRYPPILPSLLGQAARWLIGWASRPLTRGRAAERPGS